MSENSKNTVTNIQESFFRARTKTSVTIEAVDPVAAHVKEETETVAPAVAAPVEDKTKTVAPVQAEDKIQTKGDSNLFWKVLGILGLLALQALIAIMLLNKPAVSAQTPGSAPIVNPVDLPNQEVWKAVLTSANSNGNFIADLGGHGNGAIIPETAIDLQGKTWKIGRVLLTYCEDASTCFYSYGKPGDKLSRAFNVNAYTPEFVGDLFNELQYVNTGWNNNVNVTWTFVQ